jgi:hypothetical protein
MSETHLVRCAHCGLPVPGVSAKLRAKYEEACAAAGVTPLPAVHRAIGQPSRHGTRPQVYGCKLARLHGGADV